MKKTLFFGLIAAALGFTACSSEDDAILGNNTQKKGMVLNATVEQTAETRANMTENNASDYDFAFAIGDVVKVTNSAVSNVYYTFTNDGTNFKSSDAQTTASAATWYAYYPSEIIDLTNQSGTLTDVASKYAVVGTTASATTGENGLSIAMSPKVAILKIDNQKGAIDIQAKLYSSLWLKGMTASNGKFDVAVTTSPVSLLSTTATGTYYVAVPAGVQLSVKDGNTVIKSTGTNGLTAGKYYNLTVSEASTTTGTAKATINDSEVDVNWVQLWAGGPKFADRNVEGTMTFTDATKTGADYEWGANWCTPSKGDMDELVKAASNDESARNNAKVTCEYTVDGSTWGFKFTGKETGYETNSVFFPAQDGSSGFGLARYWSGEAGGDGGWVMYLDYDYGNWLSVWRVYPLHYGDCLVRPVLKN